MKREIYNKRVGVKMQKLKQSEHEIQKALINCLRSYEYKYPHLRYLFAIPNGSKRDIGTAMKLKAEGVKAGVPDLFLPIPSGDYHGMFIEMKVKPNKPNPAQEQYLSFLEGKGYKVLLAYSTDEALKEILNYLGDKKISVKFVSTLAEY